MGKKRHKRGRPVYIRDWRKHRGLNQEQLASRVNLSQATIARLERGDIAYTQPVLEALSDALTCTPADLIMRPPGAIDHLMAVFNGLSEDDRTRAIAVIKALKSSQAA